MTTRFKVLVCAVAYLSLLSIAIAQEVPASIKDATARADDAISKILAVPDAERTWVNTLGAFDDAMGKLERDTSIPIFMANVSTDAKVRNDARAGEEYLGNWFVELGVREDLYKATKAFAGLKPKLNPEQQRMLDFTLRDYRRAGMELPKEKRDRVAEIQKELNRLGIAFGTNIADDETSVPMTVAELKGVSSDVIKGLKRAGKDMVLVTMDGPTFSAVTDSAELEGSRQKLWIAYKRRGGDKNNDVLKQLFELRAELAKLLGYKTFSDYVLEPRMAKNAATVAKFYAELRPIVRKKAQVDLAEFTKAKRDHTKNPKAELFPWDYSFYKSRLQQQKYAVDSEKIAEYFPMTKVYDGLFATTQSLYGLTYKDVTSKAKSLGVDIWHPDVKMFEVTDKADNKLIGHFLLDLYPRPGKYTHAACWGLHGRKKWLDGTVSTPLAALVCNFTKPTSSKPSLLRHDEVETFFHEFGHVLHNLLTKADTNRFAGAATSRDFVEAPSQMFENWIWNAQVLNTFAAHYKTGAKLPKKTLDGMLAARNLGSGIETEHQFYYGMVDQAYHTSPTGKVDPTKISEDLFPKVELYKKVPGVHYQTSFGHLVGYEGAYYGYQWSLVYAQDMFQKFEELGILSPKAGAYYREKVLARGGTMDEFAMLRDYLGREPNLAAFLRHLGLSK
ncbi:MAG: Zn-dependent oligopeptidase [Chlorobia bacterium]|nr:Zn-dependent oligopeptidase [Fimbriimonadaceae bacterium]